MKEPGWERLMDVFQRYHADMLTSMLAAHGIEARQVQEAYEGFAYRFPLGVVQILVREGQAEAARQLYKSSGWNFDATETQDEPGEEGSGATDLSAIIKTSGDRNEFRS